MSKKKIPKTLKKKKSKIEGKITMAHGAGGSVMMKFLSQFVLANFAGDSATVPLAALDDSSVIDDIAFSIDAHTVKPLFFPGGDIGSLAVAGTVNDLLAVGAKPSALALSLVLEEGLSLDLVNKIILSIEETAKEAEVPIITGDTKTMENGALDQCIVTTAGIGNRHPNLDGNIKVVRKYRPDSPNWLLDSAVRPGDQFIINGYVADHGVAILSAREGYGFDTEIQSDVQPLTSLMDSILKSGGVVASKDPTRGGVASALYEWAQKSAVHVHVEEDNIPIREGTQAACEMLGLDPLTIGNEGKFLIAVVEEELDNLLETIRKHPLGKDAQHIGEAKKGNPRVTMETKIGGSRLVPPPVGDPIPRIC
ncbi:MAG: hydrogenase expression/formation protein HypE [Candidatus Ranarchaeia archaeon]|jgi:hydrogenase expression/formation protein HypE